MLWWHAANLPSSFLPSMHSLLIVTLPLLLGVIGLVLWYAFTLLARCDQKKRDKKAAQMEQLWAAEVPSSEIRVTTFPTAFAALTLLLIVCLMYAIFVWLPGRQPTSSAWGAVLAVGFISCVLLLCWKLVWTARLWIAYGVTSPWSRPAVQLNAEGLRYFDQIQIPWSAVVDCRIATLVMSKSVVEYVLLFTSSPLRTYVTSETPSFKLTLLSDENMAGAFSGYVLKPANPHFLVIQTALLAKVRPPQLRVWIDQLRKRATFGAPQAIDKRHPSVIKHTQAL